MMILTHFEMTLNYNFLFSVTLRVDQIFWQWLKHFITLKTLQINDIFRRARIKGRRTWKFVFYTVKHFVVKICVPGLLEDYENYWLFVIENVFFFFFLWTTNLGNRWNGQWLLDLWVQWWLKICDGTYIEWVREKGHGRQPVITPRCRYIPILAKKKSRYRVKRNREKNHPVVRS